MTQKKFKYNPYQLGKQPKPNVTMFVVLISPIVKCKLCFREKSSFLIPNVYTMFENTRVGLPNAGIRLKLSRFVHHYINWGAGYSSPFTDLLTRWNLCIIYKIPNRRRVRRNTLSIGIVTKRGSTHLWRTTDAENNICEVYLI